MDTPGWHLVAYDISDPLRLQRVHRYLRREAVAMQESVFLVQRSQRGIGRLMDELEGLMHRREDDLRAYPISDPGEIWLRGKGVMDGNLVAPDGKQRKQSAQAPARSWWRALVGEK